MESPLKDVKQLLSSKNGIEKKMLLRDLHEIIVDAETPEETAIRLSLYPAQTSAARIGHDLKIFETLAASGPKTLEELQAQTNAHPITLGRILRYMASVGMVREPSVGLFEANKKCENLADPGAVTIVTHFFENTGPLFQEMPAFLRNSKYQDVTDGKATVFQPAYHTDLDTYTWFSHNPENRSALIKYMGMEQSVRGRWLNEYPFATESTDCEAGEPVFVDVGGSVGHYCALFKTHYPSVPGRVILEDMPSTLEHALPTSDVETLGHDFFEPQPVKGAKYYHLGWVLHNWNDEKSKHILRQIKSAMTSKSTLLINDMVLPETGVPAYSAALDLVMLGACGSRERRLKEWQELLTDAGLVLKDCIIYNKELCHGIIKVALA